MGLLALGEVTILKDDRGVCKVGISGKTIDAEGNEKKGFMKVVVGFRKGEEVKNKTKIKIIDGFYTYYEITTNEIDEEGNPIIRKFPKIVILDYEILEEGTDEPFAAKKKESKQENGFDMDFYNDIDDLPF